MSTEILTMLDRPDWEIAELLPLMKALHVRHSTPWDYAENFLVGTCAYIESEQRYATFSRDELSSMVRRCLKLVARAETVAAKSGK